MGEEQNSGANWYALDWFKPSTFENFQWDNVIFLYAFALIPLFILIWWLWSLSKKKNLAIALVRKDIKWSPSALLRHLPNLIFLIFVSLLVIALARPQKTNEKVEQWTEGIDIMLVIDISESMQIEDFKPNRLEAAKDVARNFIAGRFQDRIGLVVFSGEAYSRSPLTSDYELLGEYIDGISFDLIEKGGTAIGSALAVATNRMRESDSKSEVMILLSDGDNTAGNIDPVTAAELASAYNIKIYTIAIGKEGKVPFGKDFFGRTRYVENTLDETTLRKIAEIGHGKFYRVSDNQALESVFELIDKYEKAEIKENRFRDTTDFYPIYLKWAIVMLLFWMMLKSTFVSNVLQD
ncbi:VWA domain-containing protein [Reichenbachiella carrageenanivorans]|uniref:VWA domain-containing protein n=1 Tax=Reichenbachiella carrageenanivorans TaxID=2979869 RepID=A0ABY6CYP8_9BACT|nr:VWA domain-containing protein [Reichenbachiella carrageenanivorans]UXX79051.1 VWA domain-containing protein [Reichenbachiella carrageenanivorans]